MATHHHHVFVDTPTSKATLNKRFADATWGLFLLMIATLVLLPSELVPPGAWPIGAGLFMLGLNAIRYHKKVSISRFTVGFGFVSVFVGLASFLGLSAPLIAIFLSLVGLSFIVRSLIHSRPRHDWY